LSRLTEGDPMKISFRSGDAALAFLCFSSFIRLNVKKEEPPLGWQSVLSEPPITRTTYRVGWPFSPWLTYKTKEPRPDGSTYSGFDANLLFGSWLALAAATALMGVYAKLAPAADLPKDQSSA
jgi:hypothetical protein